MTDPVEPRFLIHQATYDYLSEPLYFQLTQMNASCWVWVGKKDARLNDVSVGMPIPGQVTKKKKKENRVISGVHILTSSVYV